MGIKGLKRVISENAPEAIKEGKLDAYFGRKIAIDASMFLYSFLVAIQAGEDTFGLTDANGETTSHLQGLFNRTIRLLECGIKPVYVFDGKPPCMKGDELQKRRERKREAKDQLTEAQEAGDQETITKLTKRTVTVTPKHNEESKRLLTLLGVPVITAPSEAEAQCAALCRAGKVWATGTEDMDALTHATPILLRNLTMSESRKIPINEINLNDVLAGLDMDMKQFIDLCILLGCDYCGSIKGIGPKRAVELMKKHKSIEEVLANIDKTKYIPPEDFPFDGARGLFVEPDITNPDEIELVWGTPDEEGLIAYLVTEKNFNETRIRNALARIKKGKSKGSQGRLDTYFQPAPKSPIKKKTPVKGAKGAKGATNNNNNVTGGKRKREETKTTTKKKVRY